MDGLPLLPCCCIAAAGARRDRPRDSPEPRPGGGPDAPWPRSPATSQGTIQNFKLSVTVAAVENPGLQTIVQGPMASQVAIKMLGTNGGGFINANAAHPYENPTPLSNFLQMLSIFLIPAASPTISAAR